MCQAIMLWRTLLKAVKSVGFTRKNESAHLINFIKVDSVIRQGFASKSVPLH